MQCLLIDYRCYLEINFKMNVTHKQQFKPHSPSHYLQNNSVFNDYTLQSPIQNTLNLNHQRASSTTSIYFRNSNSNFSRKKLTVTSKDNQSQQFNNDYNIPNTNQQSLQNYFTTHDQRSYNLNSYNNSINNSQTVQNFSESKLCKNKLKRCSSPMTPTKGLKLKRSLLNEKHNQHLIKSQDKRQYFRDNQSSTIFKTNKLGKKNYQYQNNLNQLECVKLQILKKIEPLIKETQRKVYEQNVTIKKLESKLRENQHKIRQRDSLIEQFRKISKHDGSKNIKKHNFQYNLQQNNFILTKISDIQMKITILLNEQGKQNKCQTLINQKIQLIQNQLLKTINCKLINLKHETQKFLSQKIVEVSKLSECINVLDNKLVGKTQALKEMIIQLKQKVKQIQDSGTKDTNTNKSHLNIQKQYGDYQNQTQVSSNKNIRYYGNKIKQLTNTNKNSQENNMNMLGSINNKNLLNYSFVSISQKYNTQQQKQFLQNFIQIDQEQTESNIQQKDQTFISDCFFYPTSTSQTISKNASQSHSPIRNQKSDQVCKSKIGKFFISNQTSKQMSHQSSDILPAFNFPQKQRYQVDSATINKKIEAVQGLISQKHKKTGVIQPLRCFLDSSGYLKYVDSKTFVFDKKGNLIPLTGGQLYILVMKRLIQCTD